MNELEQKIEAAELLHTQLCMQEERLEPFIRIQIKKTPRSYFDLNRNLLYLHKEKEKIQGNLKAFKNIERSRAIAVLVLVALSLVELVVDFLSPINHWGIVLLIFLIYSVDLIRSENKELWNIRKLDDINSSIDQITINLKSLCLEDRGISNVGDVNLDRLSDSYWARRKLNLDDMWAENNTDEEDLKNKLNELQFENELRESLFLMYGIKPVHVYDGKVYAGD